MRHRGPPGAARPPARAGAAILTVQQVQADIAAGAGLECLLLETIAYKRCQVHNSLRFTLAPGAQMMGWDMLALGLPAAGQPFVDGCYRQQLALPGVWLEQGRIEGRDRLLLDSLLGPAGHGVMAALWLAEAPGQALGRERSETLLDRALALIEASAIPATAGVSAPAESLLVLRALGHRVKPVMALQQRVWAAWRQIHWGLAASPPRVWRT